MSRKDKTFSWSEFFEGLFWVFLCIIIFGGIGYVALENKSANEANELIGYFYITIGTLATGVIGWAVYDSAWN